MTAVGNASKDDLVLAALAVLGGEKRGVFERDAFLACWHAFPNTMRWVDSALPNPETFTASLRRLEQRGYIERVGKQNRSPGRRSTVRRRSPLEPTRSGVVKAKILEGGLERAGIEQDLLSEVRQLVPDRSETIGVGDEVLVTMCLDVRNTERRSVDEGALIELAFHKFPSRFAIEARPEFPDTGRIRSAVKEAIEKHLVSGDLTVTERGRSMVAENSSKVSVRLDDSNAHEAGDLKFAGRIEKSAGFEAYLSSGTLVRTKPDELFRMLRIAPTTNHNAIAEALQAKTRTLARIDKPAVAEYLLAVAAKHNKEVAEILVAASQHSTDEEPTNE